MKSPPLLSRKTIAFLQCREMKCIGITSRMRKKKSLSNFRSIVWEIWALGCSESSAYNIHCRYWNKHSTFLQTKPQKYMLLRYWRNNDWWQLEELNCRECSIIVHKHPWWTQTRVQLFRSYSASFPQDCPLSSCNPLAHSTTHLPNSATNEEQTTASFPQHRPSYALIHPSYVL